MNDIEKPTGTILIVDDISKNIQVLGNILRQEGYGLAYATSGQQALEVVKTDRFDLILLDIMMPQMDGFEVCRRLKSDTGTADIPVIFLTAKTGTEDVVEGLTLGGVDYVTKPFNPKELLARVRTHLQLQTAREIVRRQNIELEKKNRSLGKANNQLRKALEEIKTLRGILPVCAHCKKIRSRHDDPFDPGNWLSMESYLKKHTDAMPSHGLCPDCLEELYPEIDINELREEYHRGDD